MTYYFEKGTDGGEWQRSGITITCIETALALLKTSQDNSTRIVDARGNLLDTTHA